MHTPFNYNKAVHGGTEYMARKFLETIYPDLKKLDEYICMVMPGTAVPLSALVEDKRKVIAWVHNTPRQFHEIFYKTLSNPVFLDKVAYFVVPSISAKEMFIRDIPAVDPDKIYVINNAIISKHYNKNKFNNPEKIKAIHTSDPSRGMQILIDVAPDVKEDIEINIFNDFNPDLISNFTWDKKIKFYNRTPRATVASAMEDAHIFAYPSVFEETFCLSIVEAMSAGALPVYPNIGSLAEVTNGYGLMYEFSPDYNEHKKRFKEKLEEAVNLIRSNTWDATEQVKYVNDTYSWNSIKRQWKAFEEKL